MIAEYAHAIRNAYIIEKNGYFFTTKISKLVIHKNKILTFLVFIFAEI